MISEILTIKNANPSISKYDDGQNRKRKVPDVFKASFPAKVRMANLDQF